MNEWFKKINFDIKKYWYIPLMILIGLFFMLRTEHPKTVETSVGQVLEQNYLHETETRIIEMLRSIEGAGECKVTISLSSKGIYEYVREDGEVLVIRDENGKESPVLIREGTPEIAGVTIASSGAGSASIRNNIIQAVSTLLGIGSNKICVVMKSYGE